MNNGIFTPADILLPDFERGSEKWQGWSVIACDQFTSEPEYWEKAEALRGEISSLDLILPEAYLESEKEKEGKAHIAEAMKTVPDMLKRHSECMILLERTLPDGRIRRGIVGKIDLEQYDYGKDSVSAVRATEETVVERLPPRVAVRKEARVELPHIMIFADDRDGDIFAPAFDKKDSLEVLYDFELMLGGGRVRGYKLSGDALKELCGGIGRYEKKRSCGTVYAVGDGNHSLASAKAHYESIKAEVGDEAASTHPARWALCEIVDLNDESIAFEPIYRLVKKCSPEDVLSCLEAESADGTGTVRCIWNGGEKNVCAPSSHPLTVGALQNFIDKYIGEHAQCVCDYIHGEEALRALAKEKNCIGFLFGGIEKEELFGYVSAHGALPRKTFSMGEAKSKRYYLEARTIV